MYSLEIRVFFVLLFAMIITEVDVVADAGGVNANTNYNVYVVVDVVIVVGRHAPHGHFYCSG